MPVYTSSAELHLWTFLADTPHKVVCDPKAYRFRTGESLEKPNYLEVRASV